MKIRIIEVKEITAKTTGNKFTAYKAVTKQGKKIDCRFTKSCDPSKIPTEPCFIVVDDDKANVDTFRQYPVLWVKEVKEILPFESNNNLSDFFD